MSSAANYHFTAEITLWNASDAAVKKVREVCVNIFEEVRDKRRSNKYWTRCHFRHYVNQTPTFNRDLSSIVKFEIDDAEYVRVLKRIEGRLRNACAEEGLRHVVKSISCKHERIN